MTRNALVTGGSGFVGQWLARVLIERGWTVIAAGLGAPSEDARVLAPGERRSVTWLKVDVRSDSDVALAITTSRPDAVFHLAGVSFVPEAQGAPAHAYDVNAVGAARVIAEIVRQRRSGTIDPVIVVVGSGMQYGRHAVSEMPLTETAEQRPVTVYAASKTAQEVIALQAFRSDGIRVVCTRSFNHSGAGHGAHFLLPALVRRTLDMRARSAKALAIGNAHAVRDYLHVRDVAEAYVLLAEHGEAGESYNVCSGTGVSARQLACDVLLRAGTTAEIAVDPGLLRQDDVPVLVGSPAKLQSATGWAPVRTHNDIIDDLIHAATR